MDNVTLIFRELKVCIHYTLVSLLSIIQIILCWIFYCNDMISSPRKIALLTYQHYKSHLMSFFPVSVFFFFAQRKPVCLNSSLNWISDCLCSIHSVYSHVVITEGVNPFLQALLTVIDFLHLGIKLYNQ